MSVDLHPESNCLSEEDVQLILDGELDEIAVRRLSPHLNACEKCQSLLENRTALHNVQWENRDQQAIWARIFHPDAMSGDRLAIESTQSQAFATTDHFQTGATETIDVPDRIAGYQIRQLVGAGGMGRVYAGWQETLDRDVAIKLLKHSSSPTALARFEREVIAAGKLEHPNIVRAYDAGEVDSQLFLVTELLDGVDLQEYLHLRGTLEPDEACEVIRQAALGLQAAHDAGMIHRDLKPSNLMRTSSGLVKLLDLGLVGFDIAGDSDSGAVTDETTIVGSVDYMPPEQAHDLSAADTRSDIYSLGCCFFSLVTGRPPFADVEPPTRTAKLVAHARNERPDAATVNPVVPRPVAGLIRRMMDINPDARPQSVSGVIDALDAIAEGRSSVDNSQLPETESGKSGDGSNSGQSRLFFGLLGPLAGMLLLSVIVIKLKDGTELRIETNQPIAEIELSENESDAPTNIQINSKPASGVTKGGKASKAIASPLPSSYARFVRTLKSPQPLNSGVYRVASDRIMAGDESGLLHIWDIDNAEPVRSLALPRPPFRVAAGIPGTRDILVSDKAGTHRLCTDDGRVIWSNELIGAGMKVDAGGKRYTISGRVRLQVRSVDGGKGQLFGTRNGRLSRPTFSADGSRVLCVAPSHAVWLMDCDTGRRLCEFSEAGLSPVWCKFLANESRVLGVGRAGECLIWDIDTKEIVRRYRPEFAVHLTTGRFVGHREHLLSFTNEDRTQATIWNPLTGEGECDFELIAPIAIPAIVAEGSLLAIRDAVRPTEIHLWRLTPDEN